MHTQIPWKSNDTQTPHTHTCIHTERGMETGYWFCWVEVLWKEGFLLCFERGQSWAQPEVEGECKVQSRKRTNQCHALFSDIMLWWHLGPIGALTLLILYNCLKFFIFLFFISIYAVIDEDEDDKWWCYGGPFRFETTWQGRRPRLLSQLSRC